MTFQIQFLVTGATGGLGASIMSTLLARVPASTVAVAELQQRYPGTQFRLVDYNDLISLEAAFHGVQKLFFVSSPEFNVSKRGQQHSNVVTAAKKAGVGYVGDS
jgi:uncharacterized protein YbjT (DUF2867 family)